MLLKYGQFDLLYISNPGFRQKVTCFSKNIFRTLWSRTRRLLLHKQEIRKLDQALALDGMTLIPLRMYINEDGRAKLEIGLCKGKKNYDKRESIAKRDSKREIERRMKSQR